MNFRAQNLFGISDWSQSDHIDLENVFKNQPASLSQFGPIIGGTLAGLLLICVLMFLFALNIIKTSQEKKPILLGSTTGRVCKKTRDSKKTQKIPEPDRTFRGFPDCSPPHCVFKWIFTRTFPRNQDVTLKLKSEVIFIQF